MSSVKENEIIELITSEYSWEQVIYKIIAFEGMNPWDLDIKKLSDAFLEYLRKMKEMDFRIPAKYLIIAAVLLRMKSDDIQQLYKLAYENELNMVETEVEPFSFPQEQNPQSVEPLKLEIPPIRRPVRKIVVDELIAALRKALNTEKRRTEKLQKRRERIKIGTESISQRIEELYRKIDSILKEIKREITFSELVPKWERKEIIETFVPLIHLDHQRKIQCKQKIPFQEIFITKGEK